MHLRRTTSTKSPNAIATGRHGTSQIEIEPRRRMAKTASSTIAAAVAGIHTGSPETSSGRSSTTTTALVASSGASATGVRAGTT